MAEVTFGTRLAATLQEHGHLCLGIDPHAYLLDAWGLPDSARGAREFGVRAVEAATGRCGMIKPQVAFFERHGAAGYAALAEVLARARSAGMLVIADTKRGDVGSTLEAYAQAWLSPGSTLEADAMTISAYQGVGSLAGPMGRAQTHGKGLFVLAATSNPESLELQSARLAIGPRAGQTVARAIVSEVSEANAAAFGSTEPQGGLGSFGVVLGATAPLGDVGISAQDLVAHPAAPVLAPGFGYQGAHYSSITRQYGAAAAGTIVALSRSLLAAGPEGIAEAIRRAAGEVAECLA